MNKVNESDKAVAKSKGLKSSFFIASPPTAPRIQTQEGKKQQNQLSADEKELLRECESDIEGNLTGMFVVGHRLEQIKKSELFRATHTTFERYCNDRFDFSKSHANRLIKAYECEKHLKAIKDRKVCVPTKESQARCIADLTAEKQIEIAEKVKEMVGDKAPTAGDFFAARQELHPKPKPAPKPPAAPTVAAAKTEPAMVFDTNLVSFAELHSLSVQAYNIYSNKERAKDVEKILWKLKEALKEAANAQNSQLNGKATI